LSTPLSIGVISDTHGRMHARVFDLFSGVDHILHAGDIGTEEVLIDLRAIAPVTVVHGNVDVFSPLEKYPEETEIILGGVRVHLVHQVAPLLQRLDRGQWQGHLPQVLVYGHSHTGLASRAGDVLLFNPGSAGPRRFDKIPSVGFLTIENGVATPKLVALEPAEQELLAGAS